MATRRPEPDHHHDLRQYVLRDCRARGTATPPRWPGCTRRSSASRSIIAFLLFREKSDRKVVYESRRIKIKGGMAQCEVKNSALRWRPAKNTGKSFSSALTRSADCCSTLFMYVLLTSIAFIFLYPVLYMLSTSLMPREDLLDSAVKWVPSLHQPEETITTLSSR